MFSFRAFRMLELLTLTTIIAALVASARSAPIDLDLTPRSGYIVASS